MKKNKIIVIILLVIIVLLIEIFSWKKEQNGDLEVEETKKQTKIEEILDKMEENWNEPIKNIIADEKQYKKLYEYSLQDNKIKENIESILAEAEETAKKELCEYKIDEGGRMLDVAKEVKRRIEVLSFSAKYLEINQIPNSQEKILTYQEKSIENILQVCNNFPDWHPDHYLDTAEMTYAVALGYNYLNDKLTSEQKKTIEKNIIEKGLITSCENGNYSSFSRSYMNWNQVCNSGIATAAVILFNTDWKIQSQQIEDYQILNYFYKDFKFAKLSENWDI